MAVLRIWYYKSLDPGFSGVAVLKIKSWERGKMLSNNFFILIL
jgi:hypothetical protein